MSHSPTDERPIRRRRSWTLLLLAVAAVAGGCDRTGGAGEPPRAAVIVSPPPAAPSAGRAGGGVILFEDGWVGVALAREEVLVAAELDGQVRSIEVEVGDRVEAGQRLAAIDARELRELLDQALASLAVLEAEQRRHRVELESVSEQYERRLGYEELYSAEEIAELRSRRQAAEAALEAAAARVDQERARLEQLRGRMGRSVLVAPIAGRVAERYLDAGALVRSGTPVARLISSGGLIARFAVPPVQATALEVGQPIEFAIRPTDAGERETIVRGVVSHVAPDVDAAAQMVFAEASLGDGAGAAGVQAGTVGAVRVAAASSGA